MMAKLAFLMQDKMERFYRWVAWKMPKGFVYWCAIRLFAHATTNEYSNQNVPSLTVVDALKRWDHSDEDYRALRRRMW